MQKNALRIDVLGTAFTIVSEEDQVHLDSLLKRYKLKIEEVQKTGGTDDPLRVAILTGLTLYDEIEKMRSGDFSGHGRYEYMHIGERLEDLSQRIDRAFGGGADAMRSAGKSDRVYRLKNEFKHYDWGAAGWIPELLGINDTEARPWAEMWMGTHPGGPSLADCPGGLVPLKSRAGELPFLFKLLAAGKPLSIQAHPDLEEAAAGFARENAAGIPLNDPRRNYKDASHKPEILCAITPFTAMAGFRERQRVIELLDAFACPSLVPLRRELRGELSDEAAYTGFLNQLFTMSAERKDELSSYIARHIDEIKNRAPSYRKEWELVEQFHTYFPNDPSVIAPLYLNVIELAPHDAIFVPAGILHAYVHGFGVELMSPSDNVLRGGLTPKFVDTAELLNVLEPRAFKPDIIKPVPVQGGYASYPVPVAEWKLSLVRETGDCPETFPEKNDAVILVMQGRLSIAFFDGKGDLTLERGESVFIPGSIDRSAFLLRGAFTAYIASRGTR
jgi:mannose-6-phosphate isomerase